MRYLLPESTVLIDGHVDLIHDTRLPADTRVYLGSPTATVSLGVRADSSHGSRTLRPPEGGDSSVTYDWSDDQRLLGLAFNSIGVGSKVMGAGVKVLAMVVGAAVRFAPGRSMATAATSLAGGASQQPPDEDAVRKAWDSRKGNSKAATHRSEHQVIAEKATDALTAVRKDMVAAVDPVIMGRLERRLQYLSRALEDAKAEVSKVDALYAAWCAGRLKKYPQHVTFTLAIDELPVHSDPASYTPAWSRAWEKGSPKGALVEHIWETLGTVVEIGPISPQLPYQPNSSGMVEGKLDEQSIHWREPRLARLWIWRRDSNDRQVLEQVSDVLVTDRFSKSSSLKLEGRRFGERAAEIALNEWGAPKKLVVGDKSAVGAVADAISSAPEQFTAGLDAASKSSSALGDLSTAGAELRLKAIKRQVEQRTQELELEGINATAEDFAQLKRLQQQVEIASAQGALAPPSELATLQDELSRETAKRDLDAVQRDRAQAAEISAIQSEIERLKAEVELAKLRGGGTP